MEFESAVSYKSSAEDKKRNRIERLAWGLPKLIAGVDVAFKGDKAIGTVVVLKYPEFTIIEQVRRTAKLTYTYLFNNQEIKVGAVLRTQDSVKPIFVSPGQKIDIKNSIRLILTLTTKYRQPEPIRLAHQLTQKSYR